MAQVGIYHKADGSLFLNVIRQITIDHFIVCRHLTNTQQGWVWDMNKTETMCAYDIDCLIVSTL